jgi:uncharacterized membrane protein
MNTPFDEDPHRRPGLFAGLRSSFLTGLVVIAPVGLTIWLIWTVVGWVDGFVLPLVPSNFRPEPYIGINLRGVGVIFFLLFTIIIGWIAKGIIGRSMIAFAESLVDRMPVVRSIYSGIKQISETVFAQTERTFDQACLVQYPRRGIWAVGLFPRLPRVRYHSAPKPAASCSASSFRPRPTRPRAFCCSSPKRTSSPWTCRLRTRRNW